VRNETALDHVREEATFYLWKKKYVNLGVTELRELRQLKEENDRVRRLAADLTPDKHILMEVVQKNLKPTRRFTLAAWIYETFW
jgi:putative transposase